MVRVALPLVVFVSLACDRNLPERMWTSAHLQYFSRAGDDEVCPDILGLLEEHGQTIADALGIERPLVTYYKFDGLKDFDNNSACDGAVACAPGASVETPVSFDRHELVHAYLAHLGSPPWLLTEGAAVALSCGRYPRPAGTWQEALASDHASARLYGAGAWLVGHLLRSFPADRFLQLYRALPRGAGAQAFAATFAALYGVSLDEVWAAAVSGTQAPMWCPWECNRPGFALDGQPHVLAPVCGAGVHDLTFDLPAAGITRWRIEGSGRFGVESCDGHEQPRAVVMGWNGAGALVAPLEQGRYFVHAVVETNGAPQLAGAIGDAPSFSTACATAPDLSDDLVSPGNMTVFYPGAATERFTRLGPGTSRRGTLTPVSDAPGTLALCESCDPQSCTSLEGGRPLAIEGIAPGAILRVPPGAAMTAQFYWF